MHPCIKIIIFLFLAVLLPRLNVQMLVGAVCALILTNYLSRRGVWVSILFKIRWLLFSTIIVYSMTTPGEHLFPANAVISPLMPTYEGILAGAVQATYLIVMFGISTLLLSTMEREELILGIFLLLSPLNTLKIDTIRFAIRASLVLDYVNRNHEQRKKQHFLRYWQYFFREEKVVLPTTLTFVFPIWRKSDTFYLALITCCAMTFSVFF